MLVKIFKQVLNCCWLLPGFLLWASFPPMGERFDCFFALAPLVWLSRNGTAKRSMWLWFVNGFIFWFATLAWMPAIVKNNGPWPLVLLGWVCLAAYCALFFGAFGWLSSVYWRWARRSEEVRVKSEELRISKFFSAVTLHSYLLPLHFFGLLLVEPVLWCGLELVRSRFLGGFSWNQLGVAPINAGFGSPAAIGGVYLVSAVVILVNGTIASIAERFLTRDRRWWRTLETFVPFALIFGIYSFHSQPQPSTSTSYLSVALVQRNFPCCFSPQERENPLEVYSNLCANVSYLKPDIVILPESAYAEIAPLDHPDAMRFSQWLMRLTGAKAVLAGGGRYAQDGKAYNSAALYTAARPESAPYRSDEIQIYDKVHLVPFGEFIPGDKVFPVLQKFAPVGTCYPGDLKLLNFQNSSLFTPTSSLPIGVAICYEDTDSAQMRELAKMGAKALVFITNDSWFSYSQETISHAWQAAARAIETGLPVIRVGNSGVTGIVYPDGKANWLSASDGLPLVDAKGTLFDRVAIDSQPSALTLYTRFGDCPLAVSFTLLILGYILIYLKAIYEKRRIVSLQIG